MKKFFAILGGIVAATSILAIAAVILKKIKLSFSIESADDDFGFDSDDFHDVSVSIDEDSEEKKDSEETEEPKETDESAE